MARCMLRVWRYGRLTSGVIKHSKLSYAAPWVTNSVALLDVSETSLIIRVCVQGPDVALERLCLLT